MSDERWQRDVYTAMDLEDAPFVAVGEEKDGEKFGVVPAVEPVDALSAMGLESKVSTNNGPD